MSLLLRISNEQSNLLAEWNSRIENGNSKIRQYADAALPETGHVGLRVVIDSTSTAYVSKTRSDTVAAGESYYVGFWLRVRNAGSPNQVILWIANSTPHNFGQLAMYTDLTLRAYVYDNAGSLHYTDAVGGLRLDSWDYVVVRWHAHATNGGVYVYVNGQFVASETGHATHTRCGSVSEIRMGVTNNAHDGHVHDFDDVHLATSYPEPTILSPGDVYPEARRTVVLYRPASDDSRDFADYCCRKMGIPLTHRIPLPNASDTEGLPNYGAFQSEVENDIAAWLALNPTVDTNLTTFLVGYNVPGYFTHSGTLHSATSRLMHYGTAFSSQTDNPLYNPSTVARLSVSDLNSAGIYLCTRIDADSLANAQEIVDDGLKVQAISALPDSDIHYTTDLPPGSLAAQRLRLEVSNETTYANDALVVDAAGSYSFGSAGSRCFFCTVDAGEADSLRGSSDLFAAIVTNGYASGLGFSESTEEPLPNFEMLRIGGTLAEAMALTIEYVDYVSVAAGSPLMTVNFCQTGYTVYRDSFDDPVAYLRRDATGATMAGLGHTADTVYDYYVRAIREGIETPDLSCHVQVVMDDTGDWAGNRPDPVTFLEAEVRSGGTIRLHWGYDTPSTTPDDFAIWYGTSPPDGSGDPDTTESYTSPTTYSKDIEGLTDGASYYFRIAARVSGGATSEAITIGPYKAAAGAPPAPSLSATTSF